jgi:hypothetical protein
MLKRISLKQKYQRVIQLEFNEISKEVIDCMIAKGQLPNFKKINQEWTFYNTASEDKYEDWEPWIQWVTAHTGKRLAEHRVFRLSDAHNLKDKQIFETLSEQYIESGIVGSMNTIRGNTRGGFFLPDPWAKKCEVYPPSLEPLWELLSNNVQKHTGSLPKVKELVRAMQVCFQLQLPAWLYVKIATQLIYQKFAPLTKWRLATIFDLFLSEIFKGLLASTNFRFYTLFLNSVAHYQHHYWRNFDKTDFDPSIKYTDCNEFDDPMTYGYQLYDRIIGEILNFANQSDTLIIIASGLSQVPFLKKESEGGMNYYRLRNHKLFAQAINLSDLEVYPLMSRDWEVKGNELIKLEYAKKVLSELKVANEPLFKITQNLPNLLFIETAVTKRIAEGADIVDNSGKPIAKFNETFMNIGIKSGHHTGIGNLWVSENTSTEKINSPQLVRLTALHDLTLQALGIGADRVTGKLESNIS